jgi:hypothetical protein
MKSDYEKWVSGELLLVDNTWGIEKEFLPSGNFCTREVAIEALKHSKRPHVSYVPKDEDSLNNFFNTNGFKTYDAYGDDELEWFEGEYKTPNGEVVIAFGQFGYDG